MKKLKTNFMGGCFAVLLAMLVFCAQAQQTKEILANGSWPVPEHVYSVQIECWGAGGAGGYTYTTLNIQPAAGGGGGAYAKSTFDVTPGSVLNITVGKGGSATGNRTTSPDIVHGGNTWVVYNGETKVLAAGGKTPEGYNNYTGAAGGSIANCIFTDVAYAGGNGGNADFGGTGGYSASGGGAGAAGRTANGGNGGNGLAGAFNGHAGAAGVAGVGNPSSGKGGEGRRSLIRDWSGNGHAGTIYGGGGGGSIAQAGLFTAGSNNGGKGADGYVLITYYICDVNAGTIAEEKWICTTEDTTIIINNVTAATPAGGLYAWETSADNGTTWTAVADANAEQYTVVNTTGMFRRAYTTEHCPAFYTTPVTVTRPSDIDPGTIAVEGTTDLVFNVCKGSDFSKSLTAETTYPTVWQTSTDGTTWSEVASVSPLTLENVQNDVYVRYLADYTETCQVPSNNMITIKARNIPVVTSIAAPADLCPGLTSFDVTASVTADGTIDTYTWTGVDANTDEVATIKATAPACNHTYTYSLTVKDEYGCESAVKTGSFTTKNLTAITVEDDITTDAIPASSCMYSIPDLTDVVNDAVTSGCGVTIVSQTPAANTSVEAGTTTNVVVAVEDACGNTLNVNVAVVAPAASILREDAIDFDNSDINVTLWYGACDTLLNIETPTYTIVADGFEDEIVLSNNRSSSLNEGAILGRIAPGTYTITWKLTDPCGNHVEFTQNVIVEFPACGEGVTVTDADGNTYETVRIGCECWTKPNLRTETGATFANVYTSTEIPAVDEEMFGKLYTWYSAMGVAEGDNNAVPTVLNATGSNYPYVQGICPEGWALPSAAAYQQISTDANAMKSTDAAAWLPGSSATDALGFTAAGAGYYDASSERYVNLLGETYFWTAETTSVVNGTCCVLTQTCPQGIITDKFKGQGFSVRCVKRNNE